MQLNVYFWCLFISEWPPSLLELHVIYKMYEIVFALKQKHVFNFSKITFKIQL